MLLTDFFGVNVEAQFLAWFFGEFADSFPRRFPTAQGLTLVILDPDERADSFERWFDPLRNKLLVCYIGEDEQHERDGGTLENVERKLHFVLRTGGKPSLEAEAHRSFTHLVAPGDYPWQGAGPYRGFIGGVSGLHKEEDWAVYKLCVDQLIKLLSAVSRAALSRADQVSDDETRHWETRLDAKYLNNIDVSDLFPLVSRDEPADTSA